MANAKQLYLALPFLVLACTQNSEVAVPPDNFQSTAFIQPPFTGIDIPYEQFTLEVEKGGVFYHPSGSIIEFPANGLTDKNGHAITGKVNISYREFADPVDFFVAGIPMSYVQGEKNYTF